MVKKWLYYRIKLGFIYFILFLKKRQFEMINKEMICKEKQYKSVTVSNQKCNIFIHKQF